MRPQFTLEQRVFMIVNYYETWSRTETETNKLFAIQFSNSIVPNRQAVDYNYNKYIVYV